MAPSVIRRLMSALVATKESSLVQIPHLVRTPEVKASSMSLLPRGAYGAAYSFFSPDGGRTSIEIDGGTLVGHYSALAFISYWHVATMWRAQKIAEAPLMVIAEDQDDGSDEWLADHELVPILDMPSEDYDMGELLEITSIYLDNTGACLWVLDRDGVGEIARITPFNRREFEVKSDDSRLIASFEVQTKNGMVPKKVEDCCFFRDVGRRGGETGRSRLDTAMSWLRLGAKAQSTIHDLLDNSIWPSAIISPDKDWNPDPATYREYKDDLKQYARYGSRGKPFIALGGAQVNKLAASIKDLVPEDILNRVESIVSSVSGVPAIVLQFQVGMENSPWSQMKQARRMAYDDGIIPAWAKLERVMTRQILRPMDDDPTHFIRFDVTNITSLQQDKAEAVAIAVQMGRAATLNERRAEMGLEPATKKQDPDGKADEIPELTTPSFADIAAGLAAGGVKDPTDDGGDDTTDEEDPKDAPKEKDPTEKEAKRRFERKFKTPALQRALREEAIPVWQVTVSHLLKNDAANIAQICEETLLDSKTLQTKSRGKDRVMTQVLGYLNGESKRAWAKATTPLLVKAAERSTAVVSADLGVSYNLLHPSVLSFAKQQSGTLVSGVSKTTRKMVSDIIQGGLDEGATTSQIAGLIRDATGFSKSRSQLIARTETTNAFNGGPEESLARLSNSTGRVFTKTWSGAMDDRERDEHVALEGETVPVGEAFSNGLQYPSEPNCRCTVTFDEVTDE